MTAKRKPGSVLFVCMGNICRSPAAEEVFRRYAAGRGGAALRIDSAGTTDYHTGSLADARMRRIAANRGYILNSRARQIQPMDLEEFDLIVPMDANNLRYVQDLGDSAGAGERHIPAANRPALRPDSAGAGERRGQTDGGGQRDGADAKRRRAQTGSGQRDGDAMVRLLGAFLPEYTGDPQQAPDVPDPYYGGEQGFEAVLDMIERACPGLLQLCREGAPQDD